MTYEQIQAALAELTLAARAKQLRQASVMFMGFVPRPYEKAHCAVSLTYDATLMQSLRDSGSHMFYGVSPEDAIAKAANWIAERKLWTAEDVGRTLGVAAE